jgi:hypothetical protein
MKLVEITLSGFKRMVPESLLSAYKSMGWTVPGAKSGTPEGSQVPQASLKSTRKKKEAS